MLPEAKMRASETTSHFSASTVSGGLLAQMASPILIVCGRTQTLRRRQLLIILSIFVMAITIVWQMGEESFFRDSKMEASIPPVSTEPIYDLTKRSAVNADGINVVSTPQHNLEDGSRERPNIYTSLNNTDSVLREDDQVGEQRQIPSREGDSVSSDKFEQEGIPGRHGNGEKDSSSVEDKLEQGHVAVSDQHDTDTVESSPQHDETRSTTEETERTGDENKHKHVDAEEVKSLSTVEQDGTDEAAGAERNEDDGPATTPGNDIVETFKAAENETAETMKASESVGTRTETDAARMDGTRDAIRNLRTNKLVKDIGYTRTKCFSVSGEPHEHTCAPSVVIAGYEKCGTSALYYKLTKHPEIVAHPKWKENCPTEDSVEAMWAWFENKGTPVLEKVTSNGLLLNGCIGIVSKPIILKSLQRLNPELKVLVALRNYADWSYSFYAYRCYPGYDEGCEDLEKPSSHGAWKEGRSPTKFARLVKDIQDAGKSPYEAFEVIQRDANLFRPWLEELIDIVGHKAVMIIKQEDLCYSPRETLANVAIFLGLDDGLFPGDAYTLVSNTNDHPAEISFFNDSMSRGEISAVINSGAGILNETRVILNRFWKSECEWLRDKFDVHFSDVC